MRSYACPEKPETNSLCKAAGYCVCMDGTTWLSPTTAPPRAISTEVGLKDSTKPAAYAVVKEFSPP